METKKNVCLFGTARTKKREDQFLWIGPIVKSNTVIFGPIDSPEIKNVSQLKEKKIVTVRKDVAVEDLLSFGISKDFIIEKTDFNEVIDYVEKGKKVIEGEAKYFSYVTQAGIYYLKKRNLLDKYKEVYAFKNKLTYYFACNKKSDPLLIDKFKMVIEQLIDDGTVQKIGKGYLGEQ